MLTDRLEFVPEHDAETFAAVPAAPAVFLFAAKTPQAEPYVSKTANLRRRLQRLLGPVRSARKAQLAGSCALDRIRADRFGLRVWLSPLPRSADMLSQDLSESSAFPLRAVREASFGKRVSAGFDHHAARKLNGRSLYYGPFMSRLAAENS